jgi:hypothetical protein
MRIRRIILAPVMLAISAVGSLVAGPLVVTSAATPDSAPVALSGFQPAAMIYHR